MPKTLAAGGGGIKHHYMVAVDIVSIWQVNDIRTNGLEDLAYCADEISDGKCVQARCRQPEAMHLGKSVG